MLPKCTVIRLRFRPEEVRALLRAASGDRLEAAYTLLAFSTGMRGVKSSRYSIRIRTPILVS
jgi:hypothetical protein